MPRKPKVRSRTARDLIDELIAMVIADPTLADVPVSFTLDKLDNVQTRWHVREIGVELGEIIVGRGL